MPDISKCLNSICGLRYKCWRALAKDSPWQAYSQFPGGKDCFAFWPVDERGRKEPEPEMEEDPWPYAVFPIPKEEK